MVPIHKHLPRASCRLVALAIAGLFLACSARPASAQQADEAPKILISYSQTQPPKELKEIDLRQGEQRICLRRGPLKTTVNALPPLAVPAAAAPPAALPAKPAAEAPAPAPAKKLIDIKSPTPGTFYAAPSPDAAPCVQVGSRVTNTTVVGVIEAIKIFNEIQAECAGVIVEINVENQQPVEYGQVLFRVDPTG